MGSWKLSPSLQIIFPYSLTGGTPPKNRLQRSLAGVVPGASGSPVFEVSRGEGGWHPGAPSVGVGAGETCDDMGVRVARGSTRGGAPEEHDASRTVSKRCATSTAVMAVAYPCPRASGVVKMFPRTAIRCAGTRACVPPAAMIRAPAYAPKYRPCGKRSAENPLSGCCAYRFFKAGKSETVSCLTGR